MGTAQGPTAATCRPNEVGALAEISCTGYAQANQRTQSRLRGHRDSNGQARAAVWPTSWRAGANDTRGRGIGRTGKPGSRQDSLFAQGQSAQPECRRTEMNCPPPQGIVTASSDNNERQSAVASRDSPLMEGMIRRNKRRGTRSGSAKIAERSASQVPHHRTFRKAETACPGRCGGTATGWDKRRRSAPRRYGQRHRKKRVVNAMSAAGTGGR